MKKEFVLIALISTLMTSCAYAAPNSADYAEQEFKEMYGTIKEKVQPRPIDEKASKLAEEFAKKNNGPDPSLSRGGAVIFTYGSTMPRILCRPMRVVDIELEPGETVTTAPFIGDSVNWQVLPASSGSGADLTMHVMVKPSMPDLMTNLVIHTSRRSYHLDLVSSNKHYTPHVAFRYPQSVNQSEWNAFLENIAKQKAAEKANRPYVLPHEAEASAPKPSDEKTASPSARPTLSALDYGYKIVPKSKNIKWLPAAVYTDNVKTYIQFPQNLKVLEAPVFMAVRNGARELVNYRVVGNTYVIDAIIDNGVLLAGSGAYSQKVVIVKDKKEANKKQESLKKSSPSNKTYKPSTSAKNWGEPQLEKKSYTYADYLKERKAKKAAKRAQAEAAKASAVTE